MKKIPLMAATVGILFAACSNGETLMENQGRPIEFRTSSCLHTRAGTYTAANLSSVCVDAYKGDVAYFSDLQLTVGSDGTVSQYSASYYWPTDGGKLKFFAYQSGQRNLFDAHGNIASYSVSSSDANQKDLVLACSEGSKAVSELSAPAVNLNFRHLLSQIAVKAINTNPALEIDVLGYKIAHVSGKGSFTFNGNLTSPSQTDTTLDNKVTLPAQSAWKAAKEEVSYVSTPMSSPVRLSSSASPIAGNMILLPQTTVSRTEAGGSGSYIAVLCRILNKGDQSVLFPNAAAGHVTAYTTGAGSAARKYGYACVGIDFDWEPGYKYTYILDCSEGGAVENDDDNNTDNDNILASGAIRFSLSVDTWVTSDESVNLNP